MQVFHFLPAFKFILYESKSFVALVNAPVETGPKKPNGDQDAWLMKENGEI